MSIGRILLITIVFGTAFMSISRLRLLGNSAPLLRKKAIMGSDASSPSDDKPTTQVLDESNYSKESKGFVNRDSSNYIQEQNTTVSDGTSEIHVYEPSWQAKYKENESFLGFIRIPYTRASVALSFMEQASGLRSFREYLNNNYDDNCQENIDKQRMPGCVYAPTSKNSEPDHDDNDTYKKASDLVQDEQEEEECPSLSLDTMAKYWTESLKFMDPMQFMTYDPVTKKAFSQTNLKLIGMVRDPLSRLRDVFDQTKQEHCTGLVEGDTDNVSTELQFDGICTDDFQGWLELLAEQQQQQQESTILDMLRQSDFFNFKYGGSGTSMMENDDPRVFVMLDECLEESLLFMERRFALPPGASKSFLDSQPESLNRQQDSFPSNDEKIREIVKELFDDEYRFYKAAVEKFRAQLTSVEFDPLTMNHPCALTADL